MKKYELTVLIHPDLEINIEPAIAKIKELVSGNGGTITKEVNEGKKKLAYPIKGQDFAVYYYFTVQLPAAAPAKISSVLNITDEVIRYLLVKVDSRVERNNPEDVEESPKEETKEVKETKENKGE